MRKGLAAIAFMAVLSFASGSACAMIIPAHENNTCRVVDSERLPAASGGANALCQAIAYAAAKRAPGVSYAIEVRVLPMSRLSASITLGDGQKLSDQKFVSMDKPLTSNSFARFAEAIAAELARANTTKS